MGRARLSGLAIEPTKLEYLAKRITFYASSELKLFELLASLCAVHTQCGQPRLSYTKPDSGSESGHQEPSRATSDAHDANLPLRMFSVPVKRGQHCLFWHLLIFTIAKCVLLVTH